jgi:hypothetical protein
MKRLVIQYSTPRSGSTFIEAALRKYYEQKGYTHLAEYFNLNLQVTFTDGKITVDNLRWKPLAFKSTLGQDEFIRQKKLRVKQLIFSQGNYFFKILGYHATAEMLNHIIPFSDFIFTYRKDQWSQLLSYLISMQTGQFYEDDGIKWEEGQLVGDRNLVVDFVQQLRFYDHLKDILKPMTEICFEDFLADPEGAMRGLGMNVSLEGAYLPKKQNEKNKELAFSNIEDVKKWYAVARANTP